MIAIDWGTSSFRAYRLAPDGRVLARLASANGILKIPQGGFPAALQSEIAPWLQAGETKIILSGMVGSRQGWVEAQYLPCPAGAPEIAQNLTEIPHPTLQIKLVPGLTATDADGTPEVMRGEETQLIGTGLANALACLPGSHSKWARVENHRITEFNTYLSGEAFAAIRSATIIGRMMPDSPHNPDAFARGLARAAAQGHLLHHLFGVRALGLMGQLAETDSASYLSGLLIGHEVNAALRPGETVHLIGSSTLCALYATAITTRGGTAVILPEDAAATGLARIGASAQWT